jgi:hypothetical protein
MLKPLPAGSQMSFVSGLGQEPQRLDTDRAFASRRPISSYEKMNMMGMSMFVGKFVFAMIRVAFCQTNTCK